jgi:putative transcriptional regulator
MGYHPINVDRDGLKIMGIQFPDAALFNDTLQAIGSNMFEDFEPTPRGIEIIRDYMSGAIDLPELLRLTRSKAYV